MAFPCPVLLRRDKDAARLSARENQSPSTGKNTLPATPASSDCTRRHEEGGREEWRSGETTGIQKKGRGGRGEGKFLVSVATPAPISSGK